MADIFRKLLKLPKNFRTSPTLIAGILIGAGIKEIFDDYFSSNNNKRNYAPTEVNIPNGFGSLFEESFGLPISSKTLYYSKHIVKYDNLKKVPLYAIEHLTKDMTRGDADRSKCKFKPAENIPLKFRSVNEDYFGSGYARGHMIPAGDIKNDQTSMAETFYLTNIVPQDFENNAGFWYRLESYCRTLTKRYENVYVVSGPLFLSEDDDLNKKYVKYQVLGSNEVAVPTHLFKIILIELKNKRYAIGSFVIPNKAIDEKKILKDFQVTLNQIENYSGFQFFPKLNIDHLKDLCVHDGCKIITKTMAEMYHLSRSMKKAKSLEDLDKIWQKVQSDKLHVDKQFIDEYWEKKSKLKDSHKQEN